ncbi:hypothetical protein HEK616_76920 (plasmid) [Streptomyces nigrescens]|uniref:Secreted protein n=1 Tax=Streptomyces nigrescens TaxID=1920 RepID=A0ABM8A672_STRNI|nr:hypothetical protein HEK616_76920 [Streptomyces nigrescens]
MRARVIRSVQLSAVVVVAVAAVPFAFQTLGESGPEVTVHQVQPPKPQDAARFHDALRHHEKTGKWPCPEGGVPPRGGGSAAEAGAQSLVHEAGPEDYDCPKR